MSAVIAPSPDAVNEARISQMNREIEGCMAALESETCLMRRGAYRDRARSLAHQVAQLVASRSPAYVAQLEQERGLA